MNDDDDDDDDDADDGGDGHDDVLANIQCIRPVVFPVPLVPNS